MKRAQRLRQAMKVYRRLATNRALCPCCGLVDLPLSRWRCNRCGSVPLARECTPRERRMVDAVDPRKRHDPPR